MILIYDKYRVEVDESGAPYYYLPGSPGKIMLSMPYKFAYKIYMKDMVLSNIASQTMIEQTMYAINDMKLI